MAAFLHKLLYILKARGAGEKARSIIASVKIQIDNNLQEFFQKEGKKSCFFITGGRKLPSSFV